MYHTGKKQSGWMHAKLDPNGDGVNDYIVVRTAKCVGKTHPYLIWRFTSEVPQRLPYEVWLKQQTRKKGVPTRKSQRLAASEASAELLLNHGNSTV